MYQSVCFSLDRQFVFHTSTSAKTYTNIHRHTLFGGFPMINAQRYSMPLLRVIARKGLQRYFFRRFNNVYELPDADFHRYFGCFYIENELGMQLSKFRDRIFGQYRICSAGTSHRLKLYKLQKVGNI